MRRLGRLILHDPLVADFLAWAGVRAWIAVGLTLAGAALEGGGLVMLIPVVGILLAGEQSALSTWIFDLLARAGITETGERLVAVAALFALLICIRFVVALRRDTYLAALEQGFVADLRKRLFRAIAFQPWKTVAGLRHGPVGHALSRDVDRATMAITAILRCTGIVILLAVQLGIAFALSPVVTVAVIVFAGLAFTALLPIRRRAAAIGRETTAADYQLFASTAGFLKGLKPAKAHGHEQRYLDAFGAASDRYGGRMVAFRRDLALANLAMQAIAALMALGVIVAGHLWLGADPAALVVVLVIMLRILGPVQSLQQLSQHALFGRAAYLSAIALTEGRVGVPPPAAPAAPEPWPEAPGFTLEGVSFTPEGAGAPVLSDLSAVIPAGRVTAIAGPSGIGKTTLCDLIVGLQEPDSGRILVDGRPCDPTARARLRAALAYVGQEGLMPQESVREALTWGCPETDDATIWAALRTVDAEALIRAADGELDAPLTGEYSRFSGGERQRLRLARVVLGRPRLIVLDEATNALDVVAERAALDALFAARGDATIIMVSHRSETVDLADHVIRLEAPPPPEPCIAGD